MSVTVTTTGGGTTQITVGADWNIAEGNLIIVDANGSNVAVYAPGVWQSAQVATS